MAEAVVAAKAVLPVAKKIYDVLARQEEIIAGFVAKQSFVIGFKNELDNDGRLGSADLTQPQATYDLKHREILWSCCFPTMVGPCGEPQGPLVPVAKGEYKEWVVKSRYGAALGVCGTVRYPILTADGTSVGKSLYVFFNSPEGYLDPSWKLKAVRWFGSCFGCETRTDYEANWNARVANDGIDIDQLFRELWDTRVSFQSPRRFVDQLHTIVTNGYKVVGKLQVYPESVSLVVQIKDAPSQQDDLPDPATAVAKSCFSGMT